MKQPRQRNDPVMAALVAAEKRRGIHLKRGDIWSAPRWTKSLPASNRKRALIDRLIEEEDQEQLGQPSEE